MSQKPKKLAKLRWLNEFLNTTSVMRMAIMMTGGARMVQSTQGTSLIIKTEKSIIKICCLKMRSGKASATSIL